MPPLATIGALIEVTPWKDLQYCLDSDSDAQFIDDRSPFRFRVMGELIDEEMFYGLQGRVEEGPDRYMGLICNIMLRHDEADWFVASECGASFKVAPSTVCRNPTYDSKKHSDVPFHLHPEGTLVEGYPRMSRFGGIKVVSGPSENKG